ncbi:MAG TPA: thioredoxin family protein, partial [Gaiellaceae bacterium]|nr:thioredoxin family protein [Gaiellaceae bacterium]
KPAADLLRAQLARYSKVVVLFYEPGASYDAIQTREARAGALSAHAGFISVNVSKNREVGQLAEQYNVLESPTVLIFTRGLKLKARLEGFYDRTAVIQAVKNA